MANYSVAIKGSAAKELEALAVGDRKRIVDKILRLSSEPRLPACEKLSGNEQYRLRQGSYRTLYEIDDRAATVTVIKIGDRKGVCRHR